MERHVFNTVYVRICMCTGTCGYANAGFVERTIFVKQCEEEKWKNDVYARCYS